MIVENEYSTPSVDHLYLEVEAACASPNPGGGIQIWGSTQQPFLVRQNVARMLGLKARVRFVSSRRSLAVLSAERAKRVSTCACAPLPSPLPRAGR